MTCRPHSLTSEEVSPHKELNAKQIDTKYTPISGQVNDDKIDTKESVPYGENNQNAPAD